VLRTCCAHHTQQDPASGGGGAAANRHGKGGGGKGDAPTPAPDPSPPTPPPPADYSCSAIARVPRADRCAFVTASCPEESLLPYSRWYHCVAAAAPSPVRMLYVALVAALLPLCFTLLGDVAEMYFSPIMAHVSQSIPKMRPRFAGVTFVALGNGAPDLSSNVAAIQAGQVTLSAGGITGGAMFVQCIVAAELIAMAPRGVKCAGAMTRDVAVYAAATVSVFAAFALGAVGRAFVAWAVALYLIYAAWVFAGDEWHEAGRPDLRKMLRERLARCGSLACLLCVFCFESVMRSSHCA
jgi:sodium/potassium/calcium exchanger 6